MFRFCAGFALLYSALLYSALYSVKCRKHLDSFVWLIDGIAVCHPLLFVLGLELVVGGCVVFFSLGWGHMEIYARERNLGERKRKESLGGHTLTWNYDNKLDLNGLVESLFLYSVFLFVLVSLVLFIETWSCHGDLGVGGIRHSWRLPVLSE